MVLISTAVLESQFLNYRPKMKITINLNDDDETQPMTNVSQFESFGSMRMIFMSTCSCEKGEKCEISGIKIGIILTILESNRLAESSILSFG